MDKLIDWLLQLTKTQKKPVAIFIVAAVVGLYVWYNWNYIKDLPFVSSIAAMIDANGPLPKPDPKRLSVAVLRLNGDEDNRYRTDVVEDLNDNSSVQVATFNRNVSTEDEQEGRKRVYDLLNRSGFDVAIWGTVLKGSGKASDTTKLFWTTRADKPGSALDKPTRFSFNDDDQLKLPAVAWQYFNIVLGLVVTSSAAQSLGSDRGHYVVDKLGPFIERTRALVDNVSEINPATTAKLSSLLGDAYTALGEQSGDSTALLEAARRYRNAITAWKGASDSMEWAKDQNNLGNALTLLGAREVQTVHLQKALDAYKNALSQLTPGRTPLEWSSAQTNLGFALLTLGERETGTARLVESVTVLRRGLIPQTRDREPLSWAKTQNILGLALLRLGERERGTAHLEDAVNAYREALVVRTRERVPLDWARTQNNRGIALATLGSRESGTVKLYEAVKAYRSALLEYTHEQVPLLWAGTQNNLGAALTTIGSREPGTTSLEEARDAYNEALTERTRERVPLDWAMTENNLGVALLKIGEREPGTKRLQEAVSACRGALLKRTRDAVPLDWATSQNNLGNALVALGKREPESRRFFVQAVAAYRSALLVRSRERLPLLWAATQAKLQLALRLLGDAHNSSAVVKTSAIDTGSRPARGMSPVPPGQSVPCLRYSSGGSLATRTRGVETLMSWRRPASPWSSQLGAGVSSPIS